MCGATPAPAHQAAEAGYHTIIPASMIMPCPHTSTRPLSNTLSYRQCNSDCPQTAHPFMQKQPPCAQLQQETHRAAHSSSNSARPPGAPCGKKGSRLVPQLAAGALTPMAHVGTAATQQHIGLHNVSCACEGKCTRGTCDLGRDLPYCTVPKFICRRLLGAKHIAAHVSCQHAKALGFSTGPSAGTCRQQCSTKGRRMSALAAARACHGPLCMCASCCQLQKVTALTEWPRRLLCAPSVSASASCGMPCRR
jgi:hypothetical protein